MVCIIVMFYQTLILTAPIHCRASVAETLMRTHISTNLMKKQKKQEKCNFGVNCSINSKSPFERGLLTVVEMPCPP